MDGDSRDAGNDELTCVTVISLVICREAKFLEKLIPEAG